MFTAAGCCSQLQGIPHPFSFKFPWWIKTLGSPQSPVWIILLLCSCNPKKNQKKFQNKVKTTHFCYFWRFAVWEKSKLSFKTEGFGTPVEHLDLEVCLWRGFFFPLFHSKSWLARKIPSVLSVESSIPVWSWILEAAASFLCLEVSSWCSWSDNQREGIGNPHLFLWDGALSWV